MQKSAVLNPASAPLGSLDVLVQNTPVDVTRLIYMLYQDVEQQINRADMKAQITLSTSAIMMAMMVNVGIGVQARQIASLRPFESVAVLLYCLFITAMCGAVGRAIYAAFPRAVRKNGGTNHHPNLYFTGQIARLPAEDYADIFCQQSNDAVKRSVLGQIHSKSLVLEAKLHNVRLGMLFLSAALGLWILTRVVLLVGYAC
jgi:hypothetical protein